MYLNKCTDRFSLFLLVYPKAVKPHRFQVYNSIKHHLHTTSLPIAPAKSLSVPVLACFCLLPPRLSPLCLWPPSHCCLCLCVYTHTHTHTQYLIPSPSFIQLSIPSPDSCQSVPCIYASTSTLFLSLFCS